MTKQSKQNDAADAVEVDAVKEPAHTVSFVKIYNGRRTPVSGERFKDAPASILAVEDAHKRVDEALSMTDKQAKEKYGENFDISQGFESFEKFTFNSGTYAAIVKVDRK